MSDIDKLLTEHATRELEIRSTDTDKREIVGIAVPWGQRASIGGWFTEEFERGSIQDSDDALYFYGHREPIGRIISHRDTEDGWEITAKVSATRAGDDALTLARDGVLAKHSVGFRFDKYETDETGDVPHITHKRAKVHEVSLVPFPAYEGAEVTTVRQAAEQKEETMPTKETEFATAADLVEVRSAVEDLDQRIIAQLDAQRDDAPATDTRSVGEVLKALAAGDEATVRAYNDTQERAYTGGTTADSIVKDGWVGDLTRLIDEGNPLRSLFSSGPLPREGMNIEYGQLLADTTSVEEQENEGDDLAFGKVSLVTKTAPVKTYGGYTSLTRQEIERSSVNVLDHNMRSLALAAARRRNVSFRSHFATAVAAQVTAGNTVAVADDTKYTDWVGAIIDAAEAYNDLGLGIDALVVDKTTFKVLTALAATDGRPLMSVYGSGTNVVGEIDAKAIKGNLAGVGVVLNPKQAAPGAAFVNRLAIRDYSSPVVRLQDDNVVNLSRDFSLYFYSALADEIPAAIVPVEFSTGA